MDKLKYLSPFSLLVSSQSYGLIRIKCPFPVKVIKPHPLGQGTKYYVHRIKLVKKEKLIYVINGEEYRHNNFKILIRKR